MTRNLLLVIVASGLLVACGEDTAPQTPLGPSYFPLTQGTRWTYTETREGAADVTLDKEITQCVTVTFADCTTGDDVTYTAAQFESTGSNDPEENGVTYLTSAPTGIYRVLQDQFDNCDTGVCDLEFEQRYGSPGFLRFPLGADLAIDASFEKTHTRCEIDCHAAAGACDDHSAAPAAAVTTEEKVYAWTVDGLEDVEVGAGAFTALRFTRANTVSQETKRFWFADGVGKVLEREVDGETVLREESLDSYEVGATSCE